MKKRGFTLIELLAVIVVLAIIALIATPMVLNTIEDARKGSAKSSGYTYISELETSLAKNMIKNVGASYTGLYDVATLTTDLNITLKGDTPSEGNICIGSNGIVTKASLKINGYVVNYDGKETTTTDLDSVEDITCDGASSEGSSGEETQANLAVGAYVSMTPTSTSYTISAASTGYDSDQTINPSELNLWRVISINDDGTIDMVSEYVSSTNVYFKGQTGYLNFVGALNTIAKQYENSNYTVGSRYMGYNGQTETITDTSKFTNPAPWTSSTADNSNESVGGGDILYEKDTGLVTTALGTLTAYTPGTTTATAYWLDSRHYFYNSSTGYYWNGRYVDTGGSVSNDNLYVYYGRWFDDSGSFALRPIVTLKSGLKVTGSGTSESPWVLS